MKLLPPATDMFMDSEYFVVPDEETPYYFSGKGGEKQVIIMSDVNPRLTSEAKVHEVGAPEIGVEMTETSKTQ